MTVSDLIKANGIQNIKMAVILQTGGDIHTGSHSYWVDGESVDLGDNEEYANVEIVRELPDGVFIDYENCVWKITKNN